MILLLVPPRDKNNPKPSPTTRYNVFSGVQYNKTFIIVWVVCFCIQVLIVEAGAIGKSGIELLCSSDNPAFKTIHLEAKHWLLCMLLGVGSIPWQWVLITIAKIWKPELGNSNYKSIELQKNLEAQRKAGSSVSLASKEESGEAKDVVGKVPSGSPKGGSKVGVVCRC